jgi:catechol 2,3-dioxygenase-like lactoylglutathione lyase family enzyme
MSPESANSPRFKAGRNIAMKVPPHLYEATLAFYRDVLGLKPITQHPPAVGFEFGSNNLWIDNVPGMSQAELWLEVVTDDVEAAAKYLAGAGIARCDYIEPLPEGFQAFWISSPASIIHLVCKEGESW